MEREAAETAKLMRDEEAAYLAVLARRMVGEYIECAVDAKVWEDVTGGDDRQEPLLASAPAQPSSDPAAPPDGWPNLIRQPPAPALPQDRGPLLPDSAEAERRAYSLAGAAPVMSMGAFLRLWGDVCEQERLVSMELERAQRSRFEEEEQLRRAAYETAAGMSTLDLFSKGKEVVGEVGRLLQQQRPPARAHEPVEEPRLRSVRMEDVFERGFSQDCDSTFQDILDGLYRDKAYALIEKYLHFLQSGRGKRPREQLQLSAGDVETILQALQAEGPAEEASETAALSVVETVQQRAMQPSVLGLFQRGQNRRDTGMDCAAFSRQRAGRMKAALAKQLRGRALRALDVFVCNIDGALVTEQEREARRKAEEEEELRRSRAFRIKRERARAEELPHGGALWGRMVGETAQNDPAERRLSPEPVDQHAEQQAESLEEPPPSHGQEAEDDLRVQGLVSEQQLRAYLDELPRGRLLQLDDPMDDELEDLPEELLGEASELAGSTLSSLTVPVGAISAPSVPCSTHEPSYEPRYEPLYEPSYEPRYEPLYEPRYEPLYEPRRQNPQSHEIPLGVRGSSRAGRAAIPQPPREPQPSVVAAPGRPAKRLKPSVQQSAAAGPLLIASTAPLSQRRVKQRNGASRGNVSRPLQQGRPPVVAAVLLSAVHEVTVERKARPRPPLSAIFHLAIEGGDEWRPEETIVLSDEWEEEQPGGGLHPTSIEQLLGVCASPPAGPAAHAGRCDARAAGRSLRRTGAAWTRAPTPLCEPSAPAPDLALLAVPIRGEVGRPLPAATAHRDVPVDAEQPMHRLQAQRWRAERRAVRRAASLLVQSLLVAGAALAGDCLAARQSVQVALGPESRENEEENEEEEAPTTPPVASLAAEAESTFTRYLLEARPSAPSSALLVVSGDAALPRSSAKACPFGAAPASEPLVPLSSTAASNALASSAAIDGPSTEHVLLHVSTRERLAGRVAKHVSSPERRFVSRALAQHAAQTRLKDAERGLTYFDVLLRSEPISTDAPPLISKERLRDGGDKQAPSAFSNNRSEPISTDAPPLISKERLRDGGDKQAPSAFSNNRKAANNKAPARATHPSRPSERAPAAEDLREEQCPADSSVIFIASEPSPVARAVVERGPLCLTGRAPATPRKGSSARPAAQRYVHVIMGGLEASGPDMHDDLSVEVEERDRDWSWGAPEVAPPDPKQCL